MANRCDLVFVGLDEGEDLWGAHTVEAIRGLLPQPDMIVVKHGANSAHAHTNDGWHEVPALNGPIVDSVGAGDAFAAGFLAGRIRHGADVESWLRLGHITAMGALAQLSDVGTVADDETTRRLLAMSADEWASTTLDLR
jgi:2-dehydro-3-deoxygluconokinase